MDATTRRSSRTLWLALWLAAGCTRAAPAPTAVGGFGVALGPAGFTVTRADGTALLESFTGTSPPGDPYAPLALRDTTATWSELFGAFKVTELDTAWTQASSLQAVVDNPLAATFLDDSGDPLGAISFSSPAPGVLLIQASLLPQAPLPTTNRISLAFTCSPSDRFLGFGEQSDALDHHGHKIPLWSSEPGIGKSTSDDPPPIWFIEGARHGSSIGLPTWLSDRGYIGAVDTSRRAVFYLCSDRDDAWRIESWDTSIQLYLYDGPKPAQALERATAGILGRQMAPPPFAFAPWNDAIFGSANVQRVSQELRDRQIPSSVIWTEDFRGGSSPDGIHYQISDELTLDPTLYPDAGSLATALHAQGFDWLAYFNTFVVQGTQAYPAAIANNVLAQSPSGGAELFYGPTQLQTGMVDLFNPAAREWMKGYMRDALDIGFDGWMADYGEWLPQDAVTAGGDPLLNHNLYAAQWSEAAQETLQERAGDGHPRAFFSRSGWFGSQASTPVHWPGDQRTDFEHDDGLFTVVPMALNLGLAGWSTTGADIGGYQDLDNSGPTPYGTKELFLRWAALGALEPVMRTHHGRAAYANWHFDSDEETLEQYRRWAVFHLRLYPYLDGGAAEHEQHGLPLIRALPLMAPEDPGGWSIDDEYFLGDDLFVAPVLDSGITSRPVHLPPGDWIPIAPLPPLETPPLGGPLVMGAPISGPIDIVAPAPLGELPIWVRAGSVIPLLQDGVQTLLPAPGLADLTAAQGARTLLVFTGAAGAYTERDGTTYTLSISPDTSAYIDNGVPLQPCATGSSRGCIEAGLAADGATRVRLAGNGPLELPGYELVIQGPVRTIDVEIH